MERTAHFLVNTLALKRGGLVKAVRERANALAATGALGEVNIVVLAAQPRLELDVAALKRDGHLHPDVGAYSILRTLDPSTTDARVPYELEEGPGITVFPMGRTGREFRYFRDGLYEKYARFDEDGRLMVVEHFDPARQRYRRDEMDETGSLARTLEYRPGSSDVICQRWFGRDTTCHLTIWHHQDAPKWGMSFIHGAEPRSFSTMGGLYKYAFERVLSREPAPAIVSEFRENLQNLPKENVDDIVRSIRHPNVLKVMTAHSNHLDQPYVAGATIDPNWTRAGETLDSWDRLVLLTDAQKNDMAQQFGHEDMMRVIGQVAPPELTTPTDVDPYRLVIVARIHPKKRLDEAMRVFAHVAQAEPRARLEVFGFGYKDAEESDLTELIDELGLVDRVTFMAFTNDPAQIYASALVTMLTSASEGFPLTLLESMSHGVPVAAYDANYGPRDVIVDGSNGFLVPFGEHRLLAERIIGLMRDPGTRARMDVTARATLSRFSSGEFAQRWVEVLCSDPRPYRVVGGSIGPIVSLVEEDEGGTLRFVGNGPMPSGLDLVLVARSTGELVAKGVHRDGAWTVVLEPASKGTIVDVFASTDGGTTRKRVVFGDVTATTAAGWRVYRTANGALSLKSR